MWRGKWGALFQKAPPVKKEIIILVRCAFFACRQRPRAGQNSRSCFLILGPTIWTVAKQVDRNRMLVYSQSEDIYKRFSWLWKTLHWGRFYTTGLQEELRVGVVQRLLIVDCWDKIWAVGYTIRRRAQYGAMHTTAQYHPHFPARLSLILTYFITRI